MHLLSIYSAAIFVYCILSLPVLPIAYEDGKIKEEKSCRGPSWKAGLCVSLSKCPKLAGILYEEPFRSERLRFLQLSTCAFDDHDPWVCCPLGYVDRTTEPPPGTSTLVSKQLEVHVQSHPNAIMLPKAPNCGRSAQDGLSRIVGGETPGLGAYPWLVLLSINGPNGEQQFACGGTLISRLYVLTAAHCIKSLPPDFTIPTVRIGEYDKTHDPDCEDLVCAPSIQDFEIEEIITHDEYNLTGQRENDIALIRLSTAPRLGPYVQPVCLPQGSMFERGQHKKKRPVVAGWGRLKNGEVSSILQHVSVPIVPSKRCAQSYLGLKKLLPSMICAGGENGKDSCNGDSGGPLMMNVVKDSSVPLTFQIGIVSMGSAKCGLPYPAIYTKVSHFMLWILDNLRP